MILLTVCQNFSASWQAECCAPTIDNPLFCQKYDIHKFNYQEDMIFGAGGTKMIHFPASYA